MTDEIPPALMCRTDLDTRGMLRSLEKQTGLFVADPLASSITVARMLMVAVLLSRLRALRPLAEEVEWSVLCEGMPHCLDAEIDRKMPQIPTSRHRRRSDRTALVLSGDVWDLSPDEFIKTMFDTWAETRTGIRAYWFVQMRSFMGHREHGSP